MGRAPCCSKVGLHRGPWTPREDTLLTQYIQAHGEGRWRSLPKKAGLLRCGKSCRLRWMNYLRPDIKRGNITPDEDDLIIRLHSLLGNRWSLIAGRLPGRTDNEIKNYWNSHLSKRLRSEGTDPNTHKKLPEPIQEIPNSKRINSKKHNGNSKKTLKTEDPEKKKQKVHLPKPVRVGPRFSMPRNDSFVCDAFNNKTVSSDQGGKDRVVEAVGFLDDIRRDDHDLVDGSDFECQSQVAAHDSSSLQKLYEEYLQLLKSSDEEEDRVELDSFAESLLMI